MIKAITKIHTLEEVCVQNLTTDVCNIFIRFLEPMQKNNPHYLVRAGFNLLLADSFPSVRRKFLGFINILSILEDLASKEKGFALIKVHPMITHIGNDIDVFVSKANFKKIVQIVASRNFKVLKTREKFRKKGITLRDPHSGLELDLYVWIGWRGLKALEVSDVNHLAMPSVVLVDDGYRFKVPVADLRLDATIQAIHIYESQGFIKLSDMLKFLLIFKSLHNNLDVGQNYFNIARLYALLIKDLASKKTILFKQGLCNPNFAHLLLTHLEVLMNNAIKCKECKGSLSSISSYYYQFKQIVIDFARFLMH